MTGPVPGPPRPGMFPPRPGPPAGRPGTWPGAAPQHSADIADHHHDGDGAGHPAVDAALQSLANAARLAPAQQVAAYEEAHRTLQETLASIDRA